MHARVLTTDLKKATINEAAAEWKSHTEHYKKIGMKKAFMLADRKTGKLIHGYRIFESEQLPELIDEYGVREVLISSLKVPEAKLDMLRRMGIGLKKMSIRIE